MKPQIAKRVPPIPQPDDRATDKGSAAYDARFRRLIVSHAWANLPEAVRQRFSKRIEGERVAIYPGVIRAARCSRIGRALAQLCRIVGAPLPLGCDCGVPAAVSVSEDRDGGGQCWTRVYGRRRGFPQVIHSAKRFAGPTGLEEHIGCGIGMALRVKAIANGLEFRSDHYFVEALGYRLRFPRWLEPGVTVVQHRDEGEGGFVFSLALIHPWLGELVYQEGAFRDA
ncbi:DUF4166 domain-containing protein [Erythrobacter sp. JK5]|uniref:DUF4166 domain-containing protein n=1 Tax=Erythrobacter sp. JK5 TaxID=2829500 RepID=UPI001BA58702|nr:DUF4166 domain-containing protein [Erythrobacter sp. JK5]QUL38406.1 DUF4166 domain-containing protein [Erythrobacter sp. JK5]